MDFKEFWDAWDNNTPLEYLDEQDTWAPVRVSHMDPHMNARGYSVPIQLEFIESNRRSLMTSFDAVADRLRVKQAEKEPIW